MKKRERKKEVKAGVILGVIGIAFSILMVASINTVIVDNQNVEIVERTGTYREVVLLYLGDADPGAGASGVMEVHVNATNTSVSPYTSNLTGAYEYGEVNNSHIGSDVPYAVGVDVVVEVRWNKTHAWDSAWNLSLVRAYANSTVLGVTGIQMVEAQIATSADYLYVSYFLRDADGGAGTGFLLTEGQNVSSFFINFESLFYP